MKYIVTLMTLSSILLANVHVNQNIKALYKDVKLSMIQENYILDNQDENIYIIENVSKKIMKREDTKKRIQEKNVVEFELTTEGYIKDFKYLKRSGKRKYDKLTREIIDEAVTKMAKPTTEVPMRFIIIYEYGKRKKYKTYKDKTQEYEDHYQRIPKGTSRFLYSSKEYIREFETRKDGFINITNEMCANVTVLTMKNQKIYTGSIWWNINKPIQKGKYKMLIQVKKKCDLHVQYP